jgi:hypothetical protein
VDFARLESDMLARRAAYLQAAAAGTGSLAGQGEGSYTQVARLATGIGPLSRPVLEHMMDRMDARVDTADFDAAALLRIVWGYGTSPLLPTDLRQRADRTLLGFKWWVDEPGTDAMVYWSENHQILFASSEYLAGHFYPNDVFSNSGLTGVQHAAKARARIIRWLDARMRWGFSEWHSPVYYEEDFAPLFNLVDFAPEAEIRDRAAQAIDLLIFDLARLTHRGSFGVTAGRAYAEHKLSGDGQSSGDLIEILFGTRGGFRSRGTMSAVSFATSRYKVPHVLLGIGRDRPARAVDRARVGLSFAEAPATGVGFQSFEDGMLWWGMGAYATRETIVLSRRMIETWGLWGNPYFQMLAPARGLPEALLPPLADALSVYTEGLVLAPANLYAYRTPDAMLSSVQSYRKGQVGYQQHAWQATLGMDAVVFTTAPGTNGHDGPNEWTGSGSLPRVVQVAGAALVLYNPSLTQRAIFPPLTHAFFPRAAFDEVVDSGSWTFARKDDGYVGLFSAQPFVWQTQGAFAGREIVAPGARNAWVCVVGRRAEDGPFADFVARLEAAAIASLGSGNAAPGDPLSVRFDAPGIGVLEMAWTGEPTLNGGPIPVSDFPRFENPYCQAPFGARTLRIDFAGANLLHDHDLGTRSGDGV